MSNVAPLETVVPAPVVPRGPKALVVEETPNFNVPVLTVVSAV